jgi:hypothetical protein
MESSSTSSSENPGAAEREVHMYQFPSQRSWVKPRGMKETSSQNLGPDDRSKIHSSGEAKVAPNDNGSGVSQPDSATTSLPSTEILVDIGGEYLVSVHQVKALGAVLKMASGELGKLFFDEVRLLANLGSSLYAICRHLKTI